MPGCPDEIDTPASRTTPQTKPGGGGAGSRAAISSQSLRRRAETRRGTPIESKRFHEGPRMRARGAPPACKLLPINTASKCCGPMRPASRGSQFAGRKLQQGGEATPRAADRAARPARPTVEYRASRQRSRAGAHGSRSDSDWGARRSASAGYGLDRRPRTKPHLQRIGKLATQQERQGVQS